MLRRARPLRDSAACPRCGLAHPAGALEQRFYICAGCGHYLAMPSPARITMLADPGTFREVDRKLISVDPLQFMDRKPYRERLVEARRQTGLREAVTTGYCRIGGRRVVPPLPVAVELDKPRGHRVDVIPRLRPRAEPGQLHLLPGGQRARARSR